MQPLFVTIPKHGRNNFKVVPYNTSLDVLLEADVKIKNEILRILRNSPPEIRLTCHQILEAVVEKSENYNLSRDFAWLFIGDRLKELANDGIVVLTRLRGKGWKVFCKREIIRFNPNIEYFRIAPINHSMETLRD